MVVFALAASVTARAQTLGPSHSQSQFVIVTNAAPIFLLPDNTRTPLRIASVGSRLGLIKVEGDWYNIEFRDPQYGERVGYIEKQFARLSRSDPQPMDLSISEAGNQIANREREAETMTAQPRSIDPRPISKNAREGFWFNAGLGEGWLGCDNCEGRHAGGLSGGLSLGGTLSPRVLMGIGTTGWAKSVLGDTLTVGTVDLRLRFYPWASSGVFVTGGIGAGSISFAGETEIGGGAVLGLGIDLRIASNVSVTPFWNGFAMRSSTLDANVGQIGLGVTVH
jgi:hypothetical protein